MIDLVTGAPELFLAQMEAERELTFRRSVSLRTLRALVAAEAPPPRPRTTVLQAIRRVIPSRDRRATTVDRSAARGGTDVSPAEL